MMMMMTKAPPPPSPSVPLPRSFVHRRCRISFLAAVLASLMLLSLLAASVYVLHRFSNPWSQFLGLTSPFLYGRSYQAATTSYRPQADPLRPQLPAQSRALTDDEVAALALSEDVLRPHYHSSQSKKIAFMFLIPRHLPHERLWEHFFKGHEGKYSIFVHASEGWNLTTTSPLFAHRNIPSKKVGWGQMSMIDAERRLLAHSLLDMENEFFVLLSESCVPLWSFDYIYDYLMDSNISFVECFFDPGPHGAGRYLEGMKPEVSKDNFCKGAQWFAVNRRHALLVVADSLYYRKFRSFCKRGNEFRNCYPDEHYVQTYLHIMDPMGISNWSITHVDWTQHQWHPRTYRKQDTNMRLFKEIQSIREVVHGSSSFQRVETRQACIWNGAHRPCYLFARKFSAECTDLLIALSQGITRGA